MDTESPKPQSEPTPAPAPPRTSFEAREDEAFREARPLLVSSPPRPRKAMLLVVSLVAFALVWSFQSDGSMANLAIVVGVLIFHELGHALGMRAFGYRDVSVFFIPLFGAAASGRPRGVSRSKQAIVLLLGPLPGIVLGCVLAAIDGPRWMHHAAVMLLVINALNLAPVEPLDGGQLFQVLVFSRHRYLELAFRAVTAAFVVVASVYGELWVLAAVGCLLLLNLPHRARLLAGAARLRPLGWPEDPAALDEAQQRLLFRTAWDGLPPSWQEKWRHKPRALAGLMEEILRRATERPPSALASAGVFGLWLAGIVLFLAGSVLILRSPWTSPRWRVDRSPAALVEPAPLRAQVVATADRPSAP